MIIGTPKEIKDREFRVGIVPSVVKDLVSTGHTVLVEKGAGEGSSIDDSEYINAGAGIINTAGELYSSSEMIVKVKEPKEEEYRYLKEGLILFTFLHLAPLPKLTDVLLKKKVAGIGYETVRLDNGYLPILAPMSEVAGRMAVHVGTNLLKKEEGGRGILLGGVPGVEHGNVTIIGGGTAGANAARAATALGAHVTVMDKDIHRLEYLEDILFGKINTLMSNAHNIEEQLKFADLVIGAVLLPGGSAPKVISRDMISLMKKGSVIVDIAIDQGGCVETSRPTTHSEPTFMVDGIIHYCVTNIPGAVPRTSTFALTNATMPFIREIAERGVEHAVKENAALMRGVNTYRGSLLSREVAESQSRDWADAEDIFK